MQLATIGSDPELFAVDVEGNLRTCIDKLGGTKQEPRQVGVGFVQEDGVAAEFNTPPAKTEDEFVAGVESMLSDVGTLLAGHNLLPYIKPSAMFTLEELEDGRAWEIGCDPDYNAYSQEANESPELTSELRVAGGHVHVGWDTPNDKQRWGCGIAMDLFLGIPSILLDEDSMRRELYGKAGSVRLKEYGIEYRTLSNFWINSEEHIRWVYQQTKLAVENIDTVDHLLGLVGGAEVVYTTINNADEAKATELCGILDIKLPEVK